ncbi:MAG: hypothetical protein HYX24_01055 [Candidatus Aenigmarchaeota archaeon]|nr:hypothetical protein [Candidatus Aenigmarchaeota archaeon]
MPKIEIQYIRGPKTDIIRIATGVETYYMDANNAVNYVRRIHTFMPLTLNDIHFGDSVPGEYRNRVLKELNL